MNFFFDDIPFAQIFPWSLSMAFLHICFFSFLTCLPFAVNSSEKVKPTSAQVFFSPSDHVAERLISLIEEEKRSIKIAVYCMTHHKIAQALIQAKQRGVEVEIVVDPFSIKTRSPLKKIANSGIPIYVWDPSAQSTFFKGKKDKKFHRSLMHDKFCVFGDNLVWTGSFNFTYDAAHSHQENVIIIEDLTLAQCYIEEFNLMKARGCRNFDEFLVMKPKRKSVKK
jgi:phosphatidylserine/phosphatidylglycerophosphate/cardiolipin synthase-like enzyme